MTKIVEAKPILFSEAMVQAILRGEKTQTRRIIRGVSNQRAESYYIQDNRWWAEAWETQGWKGTVDSPYGEPGGYLWLRETWGAHTRSAGGPATPRPGGWLGLGYKADGLGEGDILDVDLEHTYWVKPPGDAWNHYREKVRWQKWLSPLHMPRWASRITLFLDELRIERLQDISEKDALAEGVTAYYRKSTPEEPGCSVSARARFRRLWDQINGERASWDQNPWVWVLTFSVATNHLQIGDIENYDPRIKEKKKNHVKI